jgi:hypothetical protein
MVGGRLGRLNKGCSKNYKTEDFRVPLVIYKKKNKKLLNT